MNRKELIKAVAHEITETMVLTEKMLTSILSRIAYGLAAGDEVILRDFGVFHVRTRNARMGRNPKTGAAVKIPDMKVVKFTPAKALREAVK